MKAFIHEKVIIILDQFTDENTKIEIFYPLLWIFLEHFNEIFYKKNQSEKKIYSLRQQIEKDTETKKNILNVQLLPVITLSLYKVPQKGYF